MEVQHHHAHAASAMAEHHLDGPVPALCWDGTGLGPDGTAWGGELLLVEHHRYERLATFRPLPLAGGERAIRHPWRLALAALLDAFDGAPPLERLPVFDGIAPAELQVVRQLIERRVQAPLAHGAGRAFDAAGALALGRAVSRYEGQVALALDNAAAGGAAKRALTTSRWPRSAPSRSSTSGRSGGRWRPTSRPAHLLRSCRSASTRRWPPGVPRWSAWPPIGWVGCRWS